MGNKASKIIADCKKDGGKILRLDNCDLTTFPKNLVSQFPELLTLSLNNNSVCIFSSKITKQTSFKHKYS